MIAVNRHSHCDDSSVRPDISEFSYGYAITEELASQHRSYLTAAPILPSLQDEGKANIGYDVRFELTGIPAFLQFKVGHPIASRRAKECRDHGWNPPFYRMYLRAARVSKQHQSLLDLEAKGHLVRYVAPAFHTPAALNEAYLNAEVATQSFWLKPSDAPVPDNKEHHVGYYGPAGPFCICSPESRLFETAGAFSDFAAEVRESAARRGNAPLASLFTRLADDLSATILSRHRPSGPRRTRSGPRELAPAERTMSEPATQSRSEQENKRRFLELLGERQAPAKRAAYLTRTFFDAELLIVAPPLG